MTYPPAIQLKNVSLELPVTGHAKHKKPVDASTSVGGRIRADRRSHQIVMALENISFCLERGERLGLVGDNGAGKSTLLRLLAGIYVPTTGTCSIKGRISTLFTSNMGLYPDATGLENVLLMGDLLGIGRKEARALAPEIIEFAELGEYIHMPLRTYSAGMRVRLGFAIATSIEPDVLLIDEVIGAGDQRFKEKATNRIRETIDAAGTLVLASHSPSVIQSFCDQAIWLEAGRIREFGPVEEVMTAYAARAKLPQRQRKAV